MNRPTFTYCPPLRDKGWGVVIENGTPEQLDAIRMSVTNNWTDSEDYKAHHPASAFLQGYDVASGWCFVEYWSDQSRHEASVALLKRIFKNEVVFSRKRPKYKRRVVYHVFGEIEDRKVRTLRKVRAIVRQALMRDQRVYVDRETSIPTRLHETSRIYRHSSGYELDLIHPFGYNEFPRKAHRYYTKKVRT